MQLSLDVPCALIYALVGRDRDVIFNPHKLALQARHLNVRISEETTVHYLQTNEFLDCFLMFATEQANVNSTHLEQLAKWIVDCESMGLQVTRVAVFHQRSPGMFRITHVTDRVAPLLNKTVELPLNQKPRFELSIPLRR